MIDWHKQIFVPLPTIYVAIADTIDLTSFSENSEWDITDSSCEYMVHDTNEGGQFFPEVVFSMNIRRKTSIYRYVVYYPVISVLFLNLMALFLDVRNTLRFHLSTLSFVTLLLVALFLGNKLGFGSLGIPKVSMYQFHFRFLPQNIVSHWFFFPASNL